MNAMSIPLLLGGCGVLIVVLVALVLIRRALIARQRGLFECSMHRGSLLGGETWQHGWMRFGTDGLRWFRAASLRLQPAVVIPRPDIEEVMRKRLPDPSDEAEGTCLVTFMLTDGRELRAIVDLSAGAALNAWLEAAPTGMFLGDAD